MIKINKFAVIIIALAIIIALFGLFLSKDINSHQVINKRTSQDVQPITTVTIKKADNTTQKIEVKTSMVVVTQE